jgi:hypothetical protein
MIGPEHVDEKGIHGVLADDGAVEDRIHPLAGRRNPLSVAHVHDAGFVRRRRHARKRRARRLPLAIGGDLGERAGIGQAQRVVRDQLLGSRRRDRPPAPKSTMLRIGREGIGSGGARISRQGRVSAGDASGLSGRRSRKSWTGL